MQSEIAYSPSFAMVTVRLDPGEQIKGEAGAMLSMSAVSIETSTQGGMLKGLRRSMLGGESFFMNTFTAEGAGAQVAFAPALPGDIIEWRLSGETVFLQSGSYLASGMGVDIDSKWGGAKTFFSKEGLFVLKCSGAGVVLVSAYGAMHTMELGIGQTVTVDTGHMVGWAEGVDYKVRKVGGWKSTLLSGEGLVVDVTGPGRIYLQTRSPEDFVSWLVPKLPTQRA